LRDIPLQTDKSQAQDSRENQNVKIQMLNAKITSFCHWDFELCYLILFGIWNLADRIATPRQVGAGNDW